MHLLCSQQTEKRIIEIKGRHLFRVKPIPFPNHRQEHQSVGAVDVVVVVADVDVVIIVVVIVIIVVVVIVIAVAVGAQVLS